MCLAARGFVGGPTGWFSLLIINLLAISASRIRGCSTKGRGHVSLRTIEHSDTVLPADIAAHQHRGRRLSLQPFRFEAMYSVSGGKRMEADSHQLFHRSCMRLLHPCRFSR
ncbi:hypothetical protein C8F04DRAFT_183164 [Mycena alexandri]|uniref:Uncharacterized protein n=1 Tax=Mycena alexandri TaxID=1745969 RepID=A0AAD6S982_9AGAR|nr:hypothetical protein C8F04DRAFT_183164 [Mycena alexandri]